MSQTAEFNTTALIVDDTSSLIEYSAGWQAGFSGSGVSDDDAEYMRTKHGASDAGRTAKFSFSGTSVAVYGSLGSVDVYGVPISSYAVDGGDTGTYTAPIIQPGGFSTHVLFYQSPTLAPGTHELVITNMNGTAPSVLWIDFILYDPSKTTSESGGGAGSGSGTTSSTNSQTSSPSSITSSSSTTTSTSSSQTTLSGIPSEGLNGTVSTVSAVSGSSTASTIGSSSSSGPAAADTASASQLTSSKHTSTGAIVGGVVGGLASLAFLAVFLFLCFRKRRRQHDCLPTITATTTPFHYKGPDQAFFISPFADPEERSRVNVLPIKRIASFSATPGSSSAPAPDHSSSNRTSAGPQSFDTSGASRSLSVPPIIRHTDSGIRIPTPVEVPPEYTQN